MTQTTTEVPTVVRYKYIPRRVRGVLDPKHLLYDGKLDSSIDSFSVLKNSSGKYVLGITPEEEAFIVEGLGLNPGDLNSGNRDNTYLQSINIEMPKAGLQLNINDPWDFLTDKILSAYTNVFAPNNKSKNKKKSYRYVRLQASDEIDTLLENSDQRKKAYKLLGTLEESRERMIMYLLNEGVRIHRQIDTKEVRKLVNDRVEKSYTRFISALEAPLFKEKGIINMAVIVGVVDVKSKLHFFDERPMASEGEPATLTNAALFLKDKTNAQIRVAITKETVNAFNRTD